MLAVIVVIAIALFSVTFGAPTLGRSIPLNYAGSIDIPDDLSFGHVCPAANLAGAAAISRISPLDRS